MIRKEKTTFVKILKKIIYSISIIIELSLFIAAIGALGYYLIDQKPYEKMWVFPLIGGTILYLIGYLVLRKMRRAEEDKREFLTTAAHNLRTPLTKIQWLITSVKEKNQDPETKERFTNMEETFKNLTMIVNRLLELTEAGKTSMYFCYLFEDSRLEYIILQATADYEMGIKQKNILLNTKIEENLPLVRVDKERIQLAINIIIENAILYNKKNGTIDINIYRKKKKIICSIKNTGIGISKEDLPKIFTKFYRTKEAITTDTDRIGLGLALAKEIIEKHKGKIYVESEGKDRETHFWFTLPISKERK